MHQNPMLTAYVSEIDQLLQNFDKNHPNLSLSQSKERDKYQKIYAQRDMVERTEKKPTLWDKF